jgi:hypothetical protein
MREGRARTPFEGGCHLPFGFPWRRWEHPTAPRVAQLCWTRDHVAMWYEVQWMPCRRNEQSIKKKRQLFPGPIASSRRSDAMWQLSCEKLRCVAAGATIKALEQSSRPSHSPGIGMLDRFPFRQLWQRMRGPVARRKAPRHAPAPILKRPLRYQTLILRIRYSHVSALIKQLKLIDKKHKHLAIFKKSYYMPIKHIITILTNKSVNIQLLVAQPKPHYKILVLIAGTRHTAII